MTSWDLSKPTLKDPKFSKNCNHPTVWMKKPLHFHSYLSQLTYRNAVMQNSNWVSFSWKIVLLRRLLLKIYQSLDVELQHKEFQSFFSLKSRALLILDVGLFAQSYWWRCISVGHGYLLRHVQFFVSRQFHSTTSQIHYKY